MHDLRTLTLILWKWFWLPLAAAGLAALLLFWGMKQVGLFPRYSATSTVAIGGDIYYSTQDTAYLELAGAMMENYRRLASLEIVTGAIAENLQLTESSQDIAEALDVVLIADTNLLSIKATHTEPRVAAAIANEAARQLTTLAPAREARNFVLIVERAVSPKVPDISAIIPPMMAAIAAFLIAVGFLLFYNYVKQPVLSEGDLAPIPLPIVATIDASAKDDDLVNWWMLKSACERLWAKENDVETGQQWPRHVLITTPAPVAGQALVAAQLAEIWRSDEDAKGPIEMIDLAELTPIVSSAKSGIKQLSPQKAHALVDMALDRTLQNQLTIFNSPPVSETFASLLLAQRVDMTLLLTQLRHVRMPQIQEAITVLNGQSVAVDGLVVIKGHLVGRLRVRSRFRRWGQVFRWSNDRSPNIVDTQRATGSGDA